MELIALWIFLIGINFNIQPTVPQTLQLNCAEGWINLHNRCYLFVPYKSTWSTANMSCHMQGGVLVEPKGYDLNEELASRLLTNEDEFFWIGYNIIGHEGEATYQGYWSDGRVTGVEVGVWAPYQPDVSSGSCVYSGKQQNDHDAARKWFMTSCSHVMASVCERNPCPSDTFPCSNGRCVALTAVCNGINNCGDTSDEMECPSLCNHRYTGYGGTVELTSSSYVSNMNCLYTIMAPHGRRIQLNFTKFNTEENLDILEIWDGGPTIQSSNLISRVSGSDISIYKTFVSSRNYVVLRFLTDGSVEKEGFKLTWSTDYQCELKIMAGKTIQESPNGYTASLTARQDVSQCIKLCTRDVTCWAFKYHVTQDGDRTCFMSTQAPVLLTDSCCDTYVKTCPGQSNRITELPDVPLLNSQLTASSIDQLLHTPLYPALYIAAELTYTIHAGGSQLITLQILHVELCCSDSIYIHDGVGPSDTLLAVLDTSSEPGFIISRGNTVYIHMDLRQHWACTGLLMAYRQGCNLTMTSETGTVMSPGYDVTPYPNIAMCTWYLKPSSGKSLRITFLEFETEDNMDYLQVYEGDSDQGVAVHTGNGYSGTTIPTMITSPDGLYLKFTTSAIGKYKGFAATYSAGCPIFDSLSLNIEPISSTYHAPDDVVLTCAEGYKFGGSYVGESHVDLSCMNDGSWNNSHIPFCERCYCGLAPSLDNGYVVQSSGVLGGDVIMFACNPGYNLIGQTNITCQSDDQWETIPECVSMLCDDLTDQFPASFVTIVNGDGIHHGSIVKITCSENDQLIGPETVECVEGVWLTEVPECKAIPCATPVIHNGDLDLTQGMVLNNLLNVTCHPGYAITASDTQTMTFQGQFHCGTDEPLQCMNVDECSLGIDQCQGATCLDTEGSYKCTCKPGYRAINQYICEDVDECTNNLALCDQNCFNNLGSYECTCNEGYQLYTAPGTSNFSLNSGEDGTKHWHKFHIGHSCVLNQCESSDILNIGNGKAMIDKYQFHAGDTVDFICEIGFYVHDTTNSVGSVTCRSDGTWNARPLCAVAYCDEDYGSSSVFPVGRIAYEAKYMLECTGRNGLVTTLERHCGYDRHTGTYVTSGDIMQCAETECGQVPYIVGMSPFITMCTYYNCTVVFECLPQYIRRGFNSDGFQNIGRCNEHGVWDFGNQFCEGGQCPDPGAPLYGSTTLSTWNSGNSQVPTVENASVAIFTCDTPGYEPIPAADITCRLLGDTFIWDGVLPTCVDKEPPLFTYCPSELEVESYSPVFFSDPVASDNTGIKSIDIYPENFRSGAVAPSSMSVTYIATDYNNNQAYCQFRILVSDTTPPKINCELPNVITAGETTYVVNTTYWVATTDVSATIIAVPASVTVNYASIGDNPILQFSAQDLSGNYAACTSQMRIDGPKCNPDTLHIYNGDIECTQYSNGQGYQCDITCLSTYVFYEDPSLASISVICSGGDWSRDMPVCTAADLAYMEVKSQFDYSIPSVVDESCGSIYEEQIKIQIPMLTSAFTDLCQTTDTSIDVSPSALFSITAEIGTTGRVVVARLTVNITPQGLEDTVYNSCANSINNAIVSVSTSVESIKTLPGNGFCPQATLQPNTNIPNYEYRCTTNSKPIRSGVNQHSCVACPPGTYSLDYDCVVCPAGTYNDDFYQTSCTACHVLTNSQTTGLMYQKQCYDDCGLYMYSTTGKAPCTDCPENTYWTSPTTCTPCTQGKQTKSRGARSEQDCFDKCPKGSFSNDGLQPCRLCPKNFFQPLLGAKTCTPCASFQITQSEGVESSGSCVDGFSRVCAALPCQNGGSCSVVRHEVLCNCTEGYTGRYCTTPVTPCDFSPCLNGAECTALSLTDYQCECIGPYSGKNCEIDAIDCQPDSCLNNGTCIEGTQSYGCACSSFAGYMGDRCQFQSDPCTFNPCQHNGECVKMGTYYRMCNCLSGFSGFDCEINLDDCESNPCTNGATCIDGDGYFTCSCPAGYKGRYCQNRDYYGTCSATACPNDRGCIDNYVDNTYYCKCHLGNWYFNKDAGVCGTLLEDCTGVSCGQHGQCVGYGDNRYSKCRCTLGYGGHSCNVNVDDCAYGPCENNGVCTDGDDMFTCACTLEGTGGINCIDNIDGCQTCVPANTETCHDAINNHTCVCRSGYTGYNCQTQIESCTSLPCLHEGVCTNPVTPEDYVCECAHPWTGSRCETEIDNCATGTQCNNRGTCISTSDGFVCKCSSRFIGEFCEEVYDLCSRLQPCVGDNNTCINTGTQPVCDCSRAYTGVSCETLLWYCTDTTCKNGGICNVVDNVGVVCSCPDGFTGADCSTNINECMFTFCPGICEDGINMATCVCSEGKVGENCQKDITYDVDYVLSSSGSLCNDDKYAPFELADTTAISVAFWVRYTVINQADSVITLYGAQSMDAIESGDWTYRISVNGAGVKFDIKDTQISSSTLLVDGNNIVDGLWHHVTVTWSNLNGYLTLYIDGEYNNELSTHKRERLSSMGYVSLGTTVTDMHTFYGRIHGIYIHNSKLDDFDVPNIYDGNTNGLPSILNQAALMNYYTVDYSSQLASGVCINTTNCPDKAFDDSQFPHVLVCPDDTMTVTERVSTLQLDTPIFGQTVPNSHTSTYGGEAVGWGIYGVGFAEYDVHNNAAVCTYRLYNKRMGCSAAVTPVSVSETCTTIEDGSRCETDCVLTQESPSEPQPAYYTCSQYGTWEQGNAQFAYPACAPFSDALTNISVSVQYSMSPDCATRTEDLYQQLSDTIKSLNTQWSSSLCRDVAGDAVVQDVLCDAVDVTIDCTDSDVAEVMIMLPFLSSSVQSGFTIHAPETVLAIAMVDDNRFTYTDFVPDVSTLMLQTDPICLPGSHLILGKCVQCGSGQYYDTTTSTCTPCARGYYRTVYDNTPLLSTCNKCPGSDITASTGSTSIDQCYTSCFVGNFYNLTSGDCELCPVGFYQDNLATTSCIPCPIELTTQGGGNIHVDSCVPYSSSTVEPPPTDQPSIGASTEAGISAGVIAAIVISIVLVLLVIIILIFCILTKRLPCMSEDSKVVPTSTPWQHVNKYGETNVKYVNYRLSDIRDYKNALDKIPIYQEPPMPSEETMTMRTRSDVNIHVPIFNEKLNGVVHMKTTYMSSTRGSEAGSEFDRTLDRTLGSEAGTINGDAQSLRPESGGRGTYDTRESSYAAVTGHYHSHGRRHGRGRPPTEFATTVMPRTLAPLQRRAPMPEVPQSSEFVRHLPSFAIKRQEVTSRQYEEFLEPSPRHARRVTPPTSQSSDKILLDSDDDLR